MCRRHHWSNASKHLRDATVRLQTSAPYVNTGMIYTLYDCTILFCLAEMYRNSRYRDRGFSCKYCQLNPSLDILVISTTRVNTGYEIYKGLHDVNQVITVDVILVLDKTTIKQRSSCDRSNTTTVTGQRAPRR